MSECFIYCVLEEEPKRWSTLLDYEKKQKATTTTKNLGIYKDVNFPYRKNGYFIERKHISTSDIKEILSNEDIVALYGVTGGGKTQIALELGYSLSKDNTVIWIESSDKSQLTSSIKASLQAMGVTVKSNSAPGILFEFKSFIEGLENCYLIFDNLTDSFDDFEAILAATKSAKAIITSQNYVEINYIHNINIKEFELCDSISYLSKRLKNQSMDDIERLSKRLYNQPLALAQAASYLTQRNCISIDDYISLLDETSLKILKIGNTISEHKIAIYNSILISMDYIKAKYEPSCVFAYIISFFQDYSVSSIFLNRSLFWPYVFDKNNYKYDKDKQVAIPYLYSNCGKGAIDKAAKEYFDSINLPLYDIQSFLSIIKILEDFDICRIKYYEAPSDQCKSLGDISSYNLYKQISNITMHGLLQEVLQSYISEDDSADALKYIDIISHLLLYGGKRKPFITISEILSLYRPCLFLVRHIIKHKDSLMNPGYKDVCEALVSSTSIMYYSEIYNAPRLNCEPLRICQEEIWDFIIEYYEKYHSKEAYYMRLLEYCLIFPMFKFEKSKKYFNDFLKITDCLDNALTRFVLNMANKIEHTDDIFMYEHLIYTVLAKIYPAIGIDLLNHAAFILCFVGDSTRDEIIKIFHNEQIKTLSITFDTDYIIANGAIAFKAASNINPSDYLLIDAEKTLVALKRELRNF